MGYVVVEEEEIDGAWTMFGGSHACFNVSGATHLPLPMTTQSFELGIL